MKLSKFARNVCS
jgi:triacylglycerol lipase